MPRKKIAAPTVDPLMDLIVGDIQNKFGAASAGVLSAETILCKVDTWASTGSFLIDSLIRAGNDSTRPVIPFGRLTEIAGLEASGKTTLCAQIMADVQAQGGICCLADTEEALDLKYVASLGVDLEKVIWVRPDHMEDLFDKFEHLIQVIRKHAPDKMIAVLWDSVGATSTQAEVEGSAGDAHMMLAPRVISKNLKRLVAPIARTKTALIVTNHLYTKPNVKFGDKWETYGGQKMKYLATLRLRLTKVGQISMTVNGIKRVIGQDIRIKTVKNKMAAGLQTTDAHLLHGAGFANDYSIFHHMAALDAVKKSGRSQVWTTPKGEEVKYMGWRGFQSHVKSHSEYGSLQDAIIQILWE